MRASQDFLNQLETLLQAYEAEVTKLAKEGILAKNTEKTYLLHSNNFVRWCKNDFIPGAKNKKKI